MTSILKSENLDNGEFSLHTIHAVEILFSWQSLRPPTTYGVVPEAAIPITKSLELTLCSDKSFHAWLVSSSAISIELYKAGIPPATNPTTFSGGVPNVGGHSDASRTPNLPLVPAPI